MTIEETVLEQQNVARTLLKVDNPSLLKTGAIGTFINIFSNIKYDNYIYYNKLLREMNPATITEFNSLLFHSSIYNVPVKFCEPALNDLSVLIPEVNISENQIQIISINKDQSLISTAGLNYTLEANIKIYQTYNNTYAKIYYKDSIDILEVDTIPDPRDYTKNINMIKISNVPQYKREINLQSIPYFDFGSNYSFSIPVDNTKTIYEFKVYIQRYSSVTDNKFVELNDLKKFNNNEFKSQFNLEELNIKYTKLNSTQFSKDVYIKMLDNSLNITVGNGIEGDKLQEGDLLIIDVKTTAGEEGNVHNIDINASNLGVELRDSGDNLLSYYKTNLKILSLSGGMFGKNLESIENSRNLLINQSNRIESLVTLEDFETAYTINNDRPFVDSKYFNSQNHIFIYNTFRDDYNNIIFTTTQNHNKDIFKENLFFPKTSINDIELISPMYYKEYKNHFISYLINPKIIVNLYHNNDNESLYEELQNTIGLHILYDFVEKKTILKIINANNYNTYKFYSGTFDATFDSLNNFTIYVNQRFLDEYCLLEDPLSDIIIDVYDQSGKSIKQYKSDEEYYQLEKLQQHYYYILLDGFDNTVETKYILNIPYIDISYFNSSSYITLYNKLKEFFKIKDNNYKLPFNMRATQSFFNTVSIQEEYRNYLIKKSNNAGFLNAKNQIYIEFLIDSNEYIISQYDSLNNLKFDLKNDIIKIMIEAEGFETSFYESELENTLKNKYPMITNIDMMTPKVFEINSAETIYNNMEEDNLSMLTIVNFVPNYFYFDYVNLEIKLEMI